MKIIYDPAADVLQITLRDGVIDETSQIAPGLILDYDEDGQLVGIEIREATSRVQDPYAVDYELGEASQDKPQPRTKPSR